MPLTKAILVVVALGMPSAALAAPAPEQASGSKVRSSQSEPDRRSDPVLVSTANDDGCSRVRRKLWVEGDGWIVRRVSLCRY
jgi:hypothetical protein